MICGLPFVSRKGAPERDDELPDGNAYPERPAHLFSPAFAAADGLPVQLLDGAASVGAHVRASGPTARDDGFSLVSLMQPGLLEDGFPSAA